MTARRQFDEYLGDLESPNRYVRLEATRYFLQSSPIAKAVLPHLLKLCNDESTLVRVQVARAIEKSKATSNEAMEVLKALLQDRHPLVRTIARSTSLIVQLRTATEQDTEFVQAHLTDLNPRARRAAEDTLEAIRRSREQG